MKHAFKHLAIAAALIASGLAHASVVEVGTGGRIIVRDPNGSGQVAPLYFGGGNGALEFSNGTGVIGGVPTTSVGGLVGALNVGKVQLTSVDGATITETPVKIGRDSVRGVVSINASVQRLGLDDQSGQVLSVGSFGGAQQDAAYLSGVLNGGRVVVKNLQFDLANKVVYADMYGQALDDSDVLGPVKTSLHTALWTITSIQGPTTLPINAVLAANRGDVSGLTAAGFSVDATSPNGGFDGLPAFNFSATNTLTGLKVTTAGFGFFAESLGLLPGSTGFTTLSGVNAQPDGWGSIKSSMNFSTVPEPGTYALMALGLLGVACAVRRQQT